MEQFFPVTRGRSATSTFCTYCGGCSVPRGIYIYIQGWKLTLARGELNSVCASGFLFLFLGLLLLLFEKR